MIAMRTRISLAAAAGGLVLLVTGCSGTSPGSPLPATTSDVTQSTSSSSSADSPLAEVKPCDLLTPAELAQFDITNPGKSKPVGGDPGCDWSKTGGFGLAIGYNTRQGVTQLNYSGKTPTSVQIGRHSASQRPDGPTPRPNTGTCDVFVAISDTSSVQIVATLGASNDTTAACDKAVQVAKIIDSRLP